jgi:hypothetical protein
LDDSVGGKSNFRLDASRTGVDRNGEAEGNQSRARHLEAHPIGVLGGNGTGGIRCCDEIGVKSEEVVVS